MAKFTDGGFRAQDVHVRVQESNKKFQEFLSQIKHYDLTNLSKFTDSESPYEFVDLFGTKEDFDGADFKLNTNKSSFTVQDKRRLSSYGNDAQFEFVRMYRATHEGKLIYIHDAGRDLCKVLKYLKAVPKGNSWVIQRNFEETQKTADLYLLHTVNSTDILWFKYKAIKDIAISLYEKWLKIYNEDERVRDAVAGIFANESRSLFSTQFNVSFDVRGLRESTDKKKLHSINGEPSKQKLLVAKLICYLPPTLFEKGKDYVTCSRRF